MTKNLIIFIEKVEGVAVKGKSPKCSERLCFSHINIFFHISSTLLDNFLLQCFKPESHEYDHMIVM